MESYLVIRFSSFGDVILTLPILESAARTHPDNRFILVTKPQYARYALEIPGITVCEADTNQVYRGITGLFRLYRLLIEVYQPVGIIDLHSVIRSQVISMLFALSGLPVFHIKKGRRARKKALSNHSNLVLPHLTDKYKDVFLRAGFQTESLKPFPAQAHISPVSKTRLGSKRMFGFAPLSKHPTKTWSFENSIQLVRHLVNEEGATVYLFGGQDDRQILESMANHETIFCKIGQINTQEEVVLIRNLDLFISMDSGNMHLASIFGIPVISIWGATHPRLGYAPLFQPEQNLIQSEIPLPCRPCSIYGSKPCKLRKEPLKCLTSITPDQVYTRVKEVLKNLDI